MSDYSNLEDMDSLIGAPPDNSVITEIEGDILRVTVWDQNVRVIELYREGEFIGGFERYSE